MSFDTVLPGNKRKRRAEKDISIKLTEKLHHYVKEIRKTAKKAKTFETQRLVRRLKILRKRAREPIVESDIKDLETQLEVLKRTDPEHIACLALSSKIRKDKKLASENTLISALTSATPPAAGANARHPKVESRLLSSKILAAEIQEALGGLRTVLEPDSKSNLHDVFDGFASGDLQTGVEMGSGGDNESDAEMNRADPQDILSHTDNDAGDEIDLGEENGFKEAVNDVDDMVDDNGWESGSVDELGMERADEMNDSEGSSEPPRKWSKQTAVTADTRVTSAFLPSLSVGYIKGDFDSDIDLLEDEIPAREKNRRGQRARQAIWEKRFGKNAKHVKKQREDAEAAVIARTLGKRLDRGWDSRGSARLDPRKAAGSISEAKPSGTKTGRNAPMERPTHPSWEAKKKLKEKESAQIVAPQGKKIIF